MKLFDETDWASRISKPDWYLEVPGLINKLVELKDSDREHYESEKENIYDFFTEKLEKQEICLGKTGPDWDIERKAINTIVIHHTSMKPGLTLARLSGIELVRLYAPYYADPYLKEDREIKGKPIYSNHLRKGKQVFYPYHWMVRKDGKAVRLLNDDEIGWHSGNWDTNCESIGIVLDNDYEESAPSEKELAGIAEIIKKYYEKVPKENILGHCEVNPKTICPSKLFLGSDGWKKKLLEII